MRAKKHLLIQKIVMNFKKRFCIIAWWCFCLKMRFRVGDSEQFRILDVDNSSYAMIQNRHQATHTKEPLLIIAIKIQQHLDTMPSPCHYSVTVSIIYLENNIYTSRFKIRILQFYSDLFDFLCFPQIWPISQIMTFYWEK